ncbi:MAG: helix-turn-helix transcriptional regulator, partial [Gammaproteobacteria bacterium]|nr:helix-turn-helix transcriptional regulator [Gammaproteobacteria bacterium]
MIEAISMIINKKRHRWRQRISYHCEMATAAELLALARRSAGLTQRTLARRAGTSQSMIARIERGDSSPSWKTLERLLSRAGFELDSRLVPKRPGVTHMMGDVTRILGLTPEERLTELRNAARFFAAAKL